MATQPTSAPTRASYDVLAGARHVRTASARVA